MLVYYPDKNDMISPPSQTSAFYMITSNKSMMGGISKKFYLKEDKWRIDAGAFMGKLNMAVDIRDNQGNFIKEVDTGRRFRFLKLYVDRKIWKKWYIGIGGKGLKAWFEADNSEDEALVDAAFGGKGDFQWGGLVRTFLDTRDNIFYPYKGGYFSYSFDYNAENDQYDAYSGNIYDIRYFQMLTSYRHILGAHVYGKVLSKAAPTNVMQFYGRAVNSIQRGFVSGDNYDRNIFSTDFEYRYLSPFIDDKLGAALFMNFGKVYGEVNDFGDADWLLGGGFGLRYFFLPYERMHAVLDFAWSEGTFAAYFGLRSPF